MENPLASNNLVAFCESTKQAPCLTEFEGGRLPSTDTKIQAQLRDKIKRGLSKGGGRNGGVR